MMPDYPGLGDGKGVHPYYNMAKNARSGLEMLDPAWFSAEKFKLKMGTNYFISGYSQGGAVAMWATHYQRSIVGASAVLGTRWQQRVEGAE